MKLNPLKLVVLALLITALTACASTVSLLESRREPDAPEILYKKILVIAVARENNVRKLFEDVFADTLRTHGVAAVSSYPLISDLEQADKRHIQALAQQKGADAVVIMRALSKSESVNYTSYGGQYQQRTIATGRYSMSAIGRAPRGTDVVKAKLQTQLFDASSAAPVWAALSNLTATEQRIEAVWKLSALLAKALDKDGVIQLNSAEFRQPPSS